MKSKKTICVCIKDIVHPLGSVSVGTEALLIGEYYVFPYIGHTLDRIGSWLGHGLHIMKAVINQGEYKDWFKEIETDGDFEFEYAGPGVIIIKPMRIFTVEFSPMWPVPCGLVIAAEDLLEAIKIAKETIKHTDSTIVVKEVDITKSGVIFYESGDY